MEKLNENNKLLIVIILVIFIILNFFIGINHEPWADEAQAWLIARDASVYDIIFKIAKYEGSPVLWHLILKILILFKLPYKFYFLVPLFFSSLGIYIILFKLEINNLYKILLPFTYFIGFEYTIKARSYCLFLPILAVIAMIYKNRKKHIYLYNIFIGILAFISLHGSVLSGMLYIQEIIEIISDLKDKKYLANLKKEIISIFFLSFSYFFILCTVIPPSDIYVNIALGNIENSNIFLAFIFWIVKILEAFILKYRNYPILGIPSFILIFILFICILNKNKNKKLFLILFFSVTLFICFVRISNHHIGIIFYSFIFSLYLVKDEINKKYKKIFFILFIFVLCVQSVWYFESAISEIQINYSAGKDVADYLKTLNYKDKKIGASGYYVVSILPYFDYNIFSGERGENTYYIWSKNNKDWVKASNKKYLYKNEIDDNYDIVILDDHIEGTGMGYDKLLEKFKKNNNYNAKHFIGKKIFKDAKEDSDKEGYYVFERIR